ncbi:MAG: hypothetical protein COW01_09940 [Bdellovibrionales bacterium CG12_big_fil_rev_8_21_14_0_65_38_15]|nr:MAG: hypothetical protein COW79_06785 [Bdellovibrionales bacterium CG22_combo_CG10-13_8_21_14_all_38_13]PIQ54457.1 MAG: hypothetical protein COW01_09940 [Bdellovibrionales bacterium CG12_big_fil_rev_8_21_14_0_65_38_15]PIR29838.1 MAG: hypothetical protein COV38_07785 [Bdellovibrionales bacterium CG11_big_fil_rev_8_21_14_0_20_38_13]
MNKPSKAVMKKSLIEKEVETSSWEIICDLAKKQIEFDYLAMSEEEVKAVCLELTSSYSGEFETEIKRISEIVLVSATKADVLVAAFKTLDREYDELSEIDLNCLYQIFIASNLFFGIEDVDIDITEIVLDNKSE